jgi:branched-chain amino acid transport system substrate-binding protein
VVALVVSGCGSRVDSDVAESSASGVTIDNPALGSNGTGAVEPGPAAGAGTAATAPSTVTGLGAAPSTNAGAGTKTSGGTATNTGANTGANTGSSTAKTGSGASTPVAQGCKQQGPPVVIGQVGSFSGIAGANFPGALRTGAVWVAWMNANGGLGCHPIRLFQVDDASNPAQSQAAVERLVSKEGAIALFGAFVPLDVSGLKAGANKMQVAVIGGDQATVEWGDSPYMYPVGGTAKAAVAGSVQQAAEAGGKKIAVLYCIESTACGSAVNNTIVKDGYAKKYGMDVVYSSSVSITQPDYTAQCQNAKNAGADTIFWGLEKTGLQRAAKSCASISYFPKLPLIALQGTFDPQDANIRKSAESGVFLTSLMFPYMVNTSPATKAYHDAIQKYAPSTPLEPSGAYTWASLQMLAKIVDNLGPAAQTRVLTRQDIFAGAAKIKNETLQGLIPPTTYKPVGPQAENPCYFGIRFTPNGTFEAPKGLKIACI